MYYQYTAAAVYYLTSIYNIVLNTAVNGKTLIKWLFFESASLDPLYKFNLSDYSVQGKNYTQRFEQSCQGRKKGILMVNLLG